MICQQKVENWLRANGLPGNIEIAHYNNIAGDDEFRTGAAVHADRTHGAGAARHGVAGGGATGAQPTWSRRAGTASVWYPPVKHGIRLRDGRGIATTGDRHPDPFVEAIRWQVHEAS